MLATRPRLTIHTCKVTKVPEDRPTVRVGAHLMGRNNDGREAHIKVCKYYEED